MHNQDSEKSFINFIKFLTFSIVLFISLFFFTYTYASVTNNSNWASITWTSTVNNYLSSYNYDTATLQGTNSSAIWGPFSVSDWTGYFGSFSHVRMFDGNCNSLSMSACELVSSGYKDYWVDGSNWTDIDPSSGPVYGCTDPDANNYDPDATDDDGSCTYDTGTSIIFPPWQMYLTSSSTCTQISEGTSTPTSFYCTATSTQNMPIITRDELFVIIMILLVVFTLPVWRFIFTGWVRK